MARGGWVYVGGRAGNKPPPSERMGIAVACERFIAEVLTPRFLPEIRPTEFNTRYRSDDPCSYAPEFDAPFARLEYVNRDHFDLSWHRHTGEWVRLFEYIPLTEALHLIESEPFFQPC